MKKLPKEKQTQLILVTVVTVLVLAGLWVLLLTPQKNNLRTLSAKKVAAANKLRDVQQAIENADKLEAQVTQVEAHLAKLEEGTASGDPYSWAINTIRRFKLPYKVEIPQFSQIDGPKPVSLLPDFPYQQATLTVGGTARFHDFGKFLADFENEFPHIRILNLTLEPAPVMSTSERERLAFKMDIVMLVKPSTS